MSIYVGKLYKISQTFYPSGFRCAMRLFFRGSEKKTKWKFLFFSILIVIVGFDLLFVFKLEAPALQENRLLSDKPAWPTTFKEWQSFPDKVDVYINDNFPPRAHLIGYMNFLRYSLGYSGSSKVFIGKDGWMFYNNGTNMALAAGKQSLDANALGALLDGFSQRTQYIERNNGKFYMLIAPLKESIFPEYRPFWMPNKIVNTETDDLMLRAKSMGIENIVDPREALISSKNSGKHIWHKYDTHWTGLGAYEAYAILAQKMNKDFPSIEVKPLSHFTESKLELGFIPRDLSLMLGVAGFLNHSTVAYETFPIHDPNKTIFLTARKDWTAPQVLTTDSTSGLKLLLMRDSFSSELLPFLKANFTTIIATHVQDGFFRKDFIDEYKPDVVILEVIEPSVRFSMDMVPGI